MTERLVINRLGHRGDGIADTSSGPLYVPYALPGEAVEVDQWPGHPDRRHLIRVSEPSPERIAPICPHFGICGGCTFQHWTWDKYKAWKRNFVVEALARVQVEADVGDLVDAHGDGRRRVVLHGRRGTHDVIEVGYAALRAHHIVPIDRCPILAPALEGAITTAWAIAEALAATPKPLDIQITATEAGLDVDVRGSGPLTAASATALARIAELHKLARITRHGERVAQRAVPAVTMGRARVPLPPGAFLQPTAAGETTLARLVDRSCGEARTVADLFSGVGPFALRLAERARVTAVDSDAPAIEALARAAATTSGLKPIATQARDLFHRPFVPMELKTLDAVVFDPPRQGAEAQARQLAASQVPVIVAVSCNPNTFARDIRILSDGGYRLTVVTPVDQFRYSTHAEIVARLER